MRVLDPEKLGEVLVKTWSEFIDRNRLIAFVLACVRDHADLTVVPGEPPCSAMRFSITNFNLVHDSFELLVEFTCPSENGVIEGSSELNLSLDGKLSHRQTVGVLFK